MPLRCRTLHIALTRYFHTSRPLTLLTTTPQWNQVEEKVNLTPTSTALEPEFTCTHLPEEGSHLNPPPSEYSRTIFADRATITIFSGLGGHGCVSFLREKYIEAGPPNGGDGGTGGNVYIQALHGETSLHKLARRNILRAGRGKNGQGKLKGGERGEDVVIQVPVGTVVREIERFDPVAAEESKANLAYGQEDDESAQRRQRREKWLLYPTVTPGDIPTSEFPRLPRSRKSAMSAAQVPAPISLDLNMPMDTPLLLAAGAIGGLGNTHFVSKTCPRPKYATKGEEGIRITLELELKLLADVGLVGLPNAGKSTLLRALTKSRTRVGNWAFTTLQPNIGTVVLDNYKGRPFAKARFKNGEPRTLFTIADIPGLVTNAHLDRGLGISFLRHVERARVLAFVLDLNAGDAVEALKALWKEVAMYEKLKGEETIEGSQIDVQWTPFTSPQKALENRQETIVVPSGPDFENPLAPEKISIASKPWFVVATKADFPGTEENFSRLKDYLEEVSNGLVQHPSLHQGVWREKVTAIPVSAINKLGTDKIVEWTIGLLND